MASDIELSEFVQNTLVQIAVGVKAANQQLHEEHGGESANTPFCLHFNMGDYYKQPGVSFDVAVTASEGSKGKAGAKISVANVLGVGGSLEEIQNDTYIHRIRFSVGLREDWS